MLLNELLENVPHIIQTKGLLNIDIDSLMSNSRNKQPNGLFFCVCGMRFDAHTYAPEAIKNGACALVVERFLPLEVPQVLVKNVRSAMAYIASAFYGYPSNDMRMIAISGTKGKTTTTFLMKSILESSGLKTGLIGTTGNLIGNKHLPSNMTTPDPIELQSTLAQMRDEGVKAVVMEASAHAVDMNRMDGIQFESACFTNFSQDHLDYFGTMDHYFQVKKQLFLNSSVKNAAINADDEMVATIVSELKQPYITFAISAKADVYARDIEITENGVAFSIILKGIEQEHITMHLTGMFNVYNALAAASLSLIMGISWQAIKEGLQKVEMVPGRVEMLATNTPYKVILDYAHSPDSLENILHTVREFTKNRLIVLFGCGGDRDHGKRPIMGEIVGNLADFSIITSDNPRTEDPNVILRAIERGMKQTAGEYIVIENRRDAIRHALEMGLEGDIIILAGKGNETYQDIAGVKHPFDEKKIVEEILQGE